MIEARSMLYVCSVRAEGEGGPVKSLQVRTKCGMGGTKKWYARPSFGFYL